MAGKVSQGGPTLMIGHTGAGGAGVTAGFDRLDAALLAQVAPSRVVCALFDTDGDALAVAERLSALNWQGVLTVLAPGLPNRRMVEQELRAAAPGLQVEVVASLQTVPESRR